MYACKAYFDYDGDDGNVRERGLFFGPRFRATGQTASAMSTEPTVGGTVASLLTAERQRRIRLLESDASRVPNATCDSIELANWWDGALCFF
ncbi:hypothetical protein GWI33_008042 [Rhynchophorus ferrugineus]|uniref:Uncharacterized protein n=1 Tax=Rhynchophorus ferrugineus TaxID=354439 RepID=A0A834IF98_RHYFE|nr:hypothetical protein GWI33_008042 [Rhynchophorus ferrugineus]